MQYVKPYASDQHLASYKNRKGSQHTLLYSVKYLQYMLKILHFSKFSAPTIAFLAF